MNEVELIPLPDADDHFATRGGEILRDLGDGFLVLAKTRICKGYRYLSVGPMGTKQKHFRVGRLLCRAFHGEPPVRGMVARHLNDVKDDDRSDNLAWGTHRQNWRDSVVNGHRRPLVGEKHGMSKLTEDDVTDIRTLLFFGAKPCDLASHFKVSRPAITMIGKRQIWKHI